MILFQFSTKIDANLVLSLDENHFEKSIFTLTRYDKSLLKYYLYLKEKINYDSKKFILNASAAVQP